MFILKYFNLQAFEIFFSQIIKPMSNLTLVWRKKTEKKICFKF